MGGVKPADGDEAVIAAGHSVLMDDDLSAYTGLQTVTIQGASGTPGMLYFKNGTSGYLKIRTGYNIVGTTGTNLGRLLANSDGVWGNTGSLAYANKAVIDLQGTASIVATYLDIALHCTEPTNKYVRTYGTKYDFTASGTTVDTTNNTIDLGTTPPSVGTAVMITGASLPGGLRDNYIYYVQYVSGNTCKLSHQNSDAVIADITTTGSGACSLITGHTNTSTATMNVLEDVTSDSWTNADASVLVNFGPQNRDIQYATLDTINSSSIVLSSNVDSIQSPGARIYLIRRNVSIRANGSQNIFNFENAITRSGKFCCEIFNANGGSGFGIYYGSAHTISGTIYGFSYGVFRANDYTCSSVVLSCGNGLYEGNRLTISGTIAGCTVGVIHTQTSEVSCSFFGCTVAIRGKNIIMSGIVTGCGNAFDSSNYNIITGNIFNCDNAVTSSFGNKISGIISGCKYGFIYGNLHIISGIVTGCNIGLYYVNFDLYGSVINNIVDYRYVGIDGYFNTSSRGFLSTGFFSWSSGGKMEHETSTVPVGKSYCHKFIYEDGAFANKIQFEIHKVSSQTVQIKCYAKHDTTGLTEAQRLHFQLISLGTGDVLSEWIASDSTDWQDGTLSYVNTSFVPMAVLITATRASGVAYALTDNLLICGGSYSFGG